MYITQRTRELVFKKYGGRCAYSGTLLKDDWQVDHFYPVRYCRSVLPSVLHKITTLGLGDPNEFHNLMPSQKIVNHYKRALLPLGPGSFKEWYLGELHLRLRNLPKNPKVEKSIKHKAYLLEVAGLFGITADTPFSGYYYFETLHFMRTR